MTKQEAYERVRNYLTRPGARRAYDPTPVLTVAGERLENGCCRYETVIDGATQRCAVGILLEREDLDRSMATFVGGVETLFEEYGLPDYIQEIGEGNSDSERRADTLYFLQSLQTAHDTITNWTEDGFEVAQLDQLAISFGLSVPQEAR